MQGNVMLQEEIVNELAELHGMKVGSDEHASAVDDVTKLIDRAVKIENADAELKEQVKARKIQNAIAIGTGVTSVLLAIWGTYTTINFEKTGNFTTLAGRFFANKLFPKK